MPLRQNVCMHVCLCVCVSDNLFFVFYLGDYIVLVSSNLG